jgi:4-amino-4-deoxy-L-arabinose transferase-like glycosyltransferase
MHDDLLAVAMEAACLLLSVLAAFRIGKKFGLSANNSAAAASAAALVPVAMNQVQQFGVDLIFTAAFLCTAAFLLPADDGKRTRFEVALAGLAAGLAFGSKYLGIILIILLVPLIFSARDDKKKLLNFIIFIAAAAVTGAYWYIRNLAVTGSPFYPIGLDLFGISVFKGAYIREAMLRSYLHVPINDLKSFGKIISETIFGKWLLCGAALLVVVNIFKRKNAVKINFAAIYICFLGPVLLVFFWFVNPYNIPNNARFVIPGLFFIFLFAGWMIERSGWNWSWMLIVPGMLIGNWPAAKRFFVFLGDAFGKTGFAADALPLTAIAVVAVILCLLVFAQFAYGGRRAWPAVMLILAIAAFIPAKSGYMQFDRYDWYGDHYLAAGWRALATVEQPVTVAYAGNCSPYGLYGNLLKNKVLYANLDGRPGLLFHDYERESRDSLNYQPIRDSSDLNVILRDKKNYTAWDALLKNNNVDLLFASEEYVVHRGVTTPIEIDWALAHPEAFRPAFHKGSVYIFQIIK